MLSFLKDNLQNKDQYETSSNIDFNTNQFLIMLKNNNEFDGLKEACSIFSSRGFTVNFFKESLDVMSAIQS